MSAAARPAPTAHGEPPGWYGKVSSLGDFAQRRLSPEWIASCDRWLSQVLVDSRAHLGASWLDTYLTAPVLCFAWTPGTLDERWWFGVLMASCDNVGRYFPLVITQSCPRPPTDGAGQDHLDRWYAGIAGAALMTLSDAAGSLDRMESALAGLSVSPSTTAADHASHVGARGNPGEPSPLAGVLGRLTSELRSTDGTGRTAWWAFDEGGVPAVTEIAGLPDGEQFGRLLGTAVGH